MLPCKQDVHQLHYEVGFSIGNMSKRAKLSHRQENEHACLVRLFHTLNGSEWLVRWNVAEERDHTLWHGVVVSNSDGCVTALHLQQNNLTGDFGQVTQELLQLTMLQDLIVSDNKLTGPLPASLANHPSLVRFDVARNLLCGTIPSEFVAAEASISEEDEDVEEEDGEDEEEKRSDDSATGALRN